MAHPETLATAIKIGDPVSWPKALYEIEATNGDSREGHASRKLPTRRP